MSQCKLPANTTGLENNILTHLIARQAAKYGERAALSAPDENDKWYDISWNRFAADVDTAAMALYALGLKPGECVATFSANRPENLFTDFACYRTRLISVSIYATSSFDQVAYIVNDAACPIIFAGNTTQYHIARQVQAQCPCLKRIVVIKPIELDPDDKTSLHWPDFLALASTNIDENRAGMEKRIAEATPDDVATLVYTSGTTGEPKGAVLTHANYDAAMLAHKLRLTMVDDRDTSMAFLPLSHIFEKGWTYFCLVKGIKVAVNRDPHEIQSTIQIVRPTCMCSVPRFWEKVFTAVNEKIASMNPMARMLVKRALKVGYRRNIEYLRLGRKAPWLLERQYQFFNKRVFSMLRHAIGLDDNRCGIFPTAGAPVSATIVEFMHSCGIDIVVGYGLSETLATVTCFPQIGWEIGSVGTPIPFVELKIGEENEVLTKSPMNMRGYWNKPEATAQAFTADGWFRTGDAGRIDESGALFLTDRIKDLFKTSNGKYIAPQAIETLLAEDKYIDQVTVIGDRRKFVSALIVPDYEALKGFADRERISYHSMAELVADPKVEDLIRNHIKEKQKGLASYEKVKKFIILPRPFTMESGELTNTLKVRRAAVIARYAPQIDALYD